MSIAILKDLYQLPAFTRFDSSSADEERHAQASDFEAFRSEEMPGDFVGGEL